MRTQARGRVFVHRSEVLRNLAVVVHGRASALVVDPRITAAELASPGDDLRASGQVVVASFATHPDWDHVLWDAALWSPDAPAGP